MSRRPPLSHRILLHLHSRDTLNFWFAFVLALVTDGAILYALWSRNWPPDEVILYGLMALLMIVFFVVMRVTWKLYIRAPRSIALIAHVIVNQLIHFIFLQALNLPVLLNGIIAVCGIVSLVTLLSNDT